MIAEEGFGTKVQMWFPLKPGNDFSSSGVNFSCCNSVVVNRNISILARLSPGQVRGPECKHKKRLIEVNEGYFNLNKCRIVIINRNYLNCLGISLPLVCSKSYFVQI